MTLISTIAPLDYPVIIGDLLLGSKVNWGKKIALPTLGEPVDVVHNSDGYYHAGLCQKLCIINDKCIVAWADSKKRSKKVLKKFRNYLKGQAPTSELVQKFVSNCSRSDLANISIIGLSRVGSFFMSFAFGSNIDQLEVADFGRCQFAGSGAGTFFSLLCNVGNREIRDGEPNAVEASISLALMLTGGLITDELSTGGGLNNLFGGGFTVGSYVGDKFSYLSDVSYLFWNYEPAADKSTLKLAPNLLKLDFLNEFLVLRKVEFGFDENSKQSQVVSESIHVISSLLSSEKFDPNWFSKLPDLNARFIVNNVDIKLSSTQNIYNTLITFSHDRNGPFMIEDSKQAYKVGFNNEFYGDLIDRLRQGNYEQAFG